MNIFKTTDENKKSNTHFFHFILSDIKEKKCIYLYTHPFSFFSQFSKRKEMHLLFPRLSGGSYEKKIRFCVCLLWGQK